MAAYRAPPWSPRSLRDFAKIVDVFDKAGASFVSVTQAFNTTTSMGRLTLNMLLSFAQFEREVTSERIRDKIAASKKKGMWMGGLPPLGYDVDDRKLVVNPVEAKTVRHIHRRYAALGSVLALQEELDRHGIRSKVRVDKYGRQTGGKPLARGALYLMLQNRIYRGETVHKDQSYPGQHAAIIQQGLWDEVQKTLASNRVERKNGVRAREPSLLAGLIHDGAGERMTPTHANKKGRRYRYYVTHSLIKRGRPKASDSARRVPAGDIERLVQVRIVSFLRDESELLGAMANTVTQAHEVESLVAGAAGLAERWQSLHATEKREWIRKVVARVTVAPTTIEIGIRSGQLAEILQSDGHLGDSEDPVLPDEPIMVLTVAARLKRTGIEKKLVIGDGIKQSRANVEAGLHTLVARAHRLQVVFLAGGRSISEMAKEFGVSSSYFTRMLRVSFLAPDITRAILQGRQPLGLTASKLIADFRAPIDWQEQRTRLRPC